MKRYDYTIPGENDTASRLDYEVRDSDGNVLISFATNSQREGKFYFSESDGTYHQTKGTCQFSMPRDKNAARAKLRRMADALIDN